MEASCSYTERVGAVSNSALALTVSKKATNTWFKKFKDLGVSNATGYDWEHIPENLRRQVTESTNTVQAPARTVVQVKQLVGYCDQSTIRTEVFTTEMTVSLATKKCLPQESVELLLRCDATEEEVSF